MEPTITLILGLVLGVVITFAAQASISSDWLGKKQPLPPVKNDQK